MTSPLATGEVLSPTFVMEPVVSGMTISNTSPSMNTGPDDASDKFWELEKRANNDKHHVGVVAKMRRSVMFPNLIDLLREGAITLDGLDGFSDELREMLTIVMHWGE